MRYILFLICLFMLAGVNAEVIYRSVDKDGNPVFSDTPSAGAEKIEIQEVQTITLPPIESSSAGTKTRKNEAPAAYNAITISKPINDESIRDNSGNISVSVTVEPGLRTNHSIALYLDGKEVQSSPATSFNLKNVDRGTHQLRASVKDPAGHLQISSKSVTFHVLRVSVKRPTN